MSSSKLPPELAQRIALDCAAARHAIRSNEGRDLLDKVRAIELALEYRRKALQGGEP